jgi:hypothetical protein
MVLLPFSLANTGNYNFYFISAASGADSPGKKIKDIDIFFWIIRIVSSLFQAGRFGG